MFTSFKSILKTSNCGHLADNVSMGREKRRRRLEAGRDIPTPEQVKRLITTSLAPEDLRRRALLLTVFVHRLAFERIARPALERH